MYQAHLMPGATTLVQATDAHPDHNIPPAGGSLLLLLLPYNASSIQQLQTSSQKQSNPAHSFPLTLKINPTSSCLVQLLSNPPRACDTILQPHPYPFIHSGTLAFLPPVFHITIGTYTSLHFAGNLPVEEETDNGTRCPRMKAIGRILL